MMQTIQSWFYLTQNYLLPFGESNYSRGDGYWTKGEEEHNSDFFGRLTDRKSQREDWYTLTKYVAEPLCTISNVGFFYVGLKHRSFELVTAGTLSAISHAIPRQWLNTADKLGVLLVLSKFAFEFEAVRQSPWLVLPLAGACAINALDAYLARKKSYTWPHVAWHISAAVLADIFLSAVEKR